LLTSSDSPERARKLWQEHHHFSRWKRKQWVSDQGNPEEEVVVERKRRQKQEKFKLHLDAAKVEVLLPEIGQKIDFD
jgi:hypothetical protein